jgi:hypothetical protein
MGQSGGERWKRWPQGDGAAGQNDAIGETGNDHDIFITALSILKTNMLL